MDRKLLFNRKLEKYSFNFAVTTAAIGILIFTLMSGYILTAAFAAKPSGGFLGSNNCSYNKLGTTKTCCWRHATTTYKFPTPTVCQTCNIDDNGTASNCTDPYRTSIIDPDKSGDMTNPEDNGGVLSNNNDESSGSKGIDPGTIQEDGTYTEDSESSNSGIPKGIDPNNSGGVFNQ